MSERAGIARACLIAPLAAPVACAVALVGVSVAQGLFGRASLPSPAAAFDLVVGVFAVGTPLAYAGALLVGMPAVLALRRCGLLSRWALWAVGGCLGCVVSFGLAPYLRGELFSVLFPWWAGSFLGITSAEVCWRLLPREAREQSCVPGHPAATTLPIKKSHGP